MKILLIVPSNCSSNCSSNCDFCLNNEQEIKLQRLYGDAKIKKLPCGSIFCWHDIITSGKDCDVLAVCPCLIQASFDSSYISIVTNCTKPIITYINNNWLEFKINKVQA